MKYLIEEVDEEFVLWLLWRLWKNRNEFVFRGRDFFVYITVRKVWEECGGLEK